MSMAELADIIADYMNDRGMSDYSDAEHDVAAALEY